jgi:Effector-associated domain 11
MRAAFDQVKNHIKVGETNRALQALNTIVTEHFKDQEYRFLLLSARFSKLENNFLSGIIEQNNYFVQLNKINKSILFFMDSLIKAPLPFYYRYYVRIVLAFWGFLLGFLLYLYLSPATKLQVELENLAVTQVIFRQRNAIDFFDQSTLMSKAQLQGYKSIMVNGDTISIDPNLDFKYTRKISTNDGLAFTPIVDGAFELKNIRIGSFIIHPSVSSKISIEARNNHSSAFLVNHATSIYLAFHPYDTLDFETSNNSVEGWNEMNDYAGEDLRARIIYKGEKENVHVYGDSNATFSFVFLSKEAINLEQANFEIDSLEFTKRQKIQGDVRLLSTVKSGIIHIKYPNKQIELKENEFLSLMSKKPLSLRSLKIKNGLIFLNINGTVNVLKKGSNQDFYTLMPRKLEVYFSKHLVLFVFLLILSVSLSIFYWTVSKNKINQL